MGKEGVNFEAFQNKVSNILNIAYGEDKFQIGTVRPNINMAVLFLQICLVGFLKHLLKVLLPFFQPVGFGDGSNDQSDNNKEE